VHGEAPNAATALDADPPRAHGPSMDCTLRRDANPRSTGRIRPTDASHGCSRSMHGCATMDRPLLQLSRDGLSDVTFCLGFCRRAGSRRGSLELR
jgi:hypothetical protein